MRCWRHPGTKPFQPVLHQHSILNPILYQKKNTMMTPSPLLTLTTNDLSPLYHSSLSLDNVLTKVSVILWLDLFISPGMTMYYLLQLTQTLGHFAFLSAKNVLVTGPPNVNPFCFGHTTNTNFSAYLHIVTTPGKLTGWIGLPTESTNSIITNFCPELLGLTQSVRFIRTDAGTAFTSVKFIAKCTNLGIKFDAAAPQNQEMNGMCKG